jgi:diguanylate cyclase (GGDEF)-like protein
MSLKSLSVGLAGKLLLASFVPAQVPLFVVLVAHRSGLRGPALLATAAVSLLLSAIVAVWAVQTTLRPIKRVRRSLRAIADANQIREPSSPEATEDERIVGALDKSVRELREASTIDPLTAIGNRRACEQRLKADLARARRNGLPFSLAFFDLDHLKQINDAYGHAVGDQCLIHLAETLKNHVREGDWVTRWGGDEFVLGLWNADGDQAQAVCDRVLVALRSKPFNGAEPITASVGICQADLTGDADCVIRKADLALLDAKRAGRDRLAVFRWR